MKVLVGLTDIGQNLAEHYGLLACQYAPGQVKCKDAMTSIPSNRISIGVVGEFALNLLSNTLYYLSMYVAGHQEHRIFLLHICWNPESIDSLLVFSLHE